jgi:Ca2+-binding RTX toxin-like protein
MAYNSSGTNGNDTLNQSGESGPGTIVGLGGNDCIFTGSGLATVTGESGSDTVVLQTGNTGSVDGGTQNDSIYAAGPVNPMVLLGGDGLDTIVASSTTGGLTILGGSDSSDNADSIVAGAGNHVVFGNGGNDTLTWGLGASTFVGGFGNDSFRTVGGGTFADIVFGNEGNDTITMTGGNDTIFGGQGDDSLSGFYAPGNNAQLFGNEGADTIVINDDGVNSAGNVTILGGNGSADGGDQIYSRNGSDLIFGNGGADSIYTDAGSVSGSGHDTVVGGFGNDFVFEIGGNNLHFANEGDDTLVWGGDEAGGENTVFGGQGNDSIRMDSVSAAADLLHGNEGNDTCRGLSDADTISGGSGSDVFLYASADEDGNKVAAGGRIEHLTDLNWAEDRIDTFNPVALAADVGAQSGANLTAAASNAIEAALTLTGGANVNVSAQFTFDGRTFLAINQDTAYGRFTDAGDLLIDITGVTGTIATTNFI